MDDSKLEKKLEQVDSDVSNMVTNLVRDEKDLILVGAVLLKYALTTYSATLHRDDVQMILDTAMEEYESVNMLGGESFENLSKTVH
jgi:hypothetical protein|tara:strand:+ start:626 stop:883 length:258 start_codon:yes stop_codon:yes gene_type:complete